MDIPLAMQANMLLVFVSLGLVQLYLEGTTERRRRYPEGLVRNLQYVLGAPALLSLVLFLLDPDIWAGVFVPVSPRIEIAGVTIFDAAALAILWAHLSLRRSWSAELETRADHRLVETGPYRWIRHPLYSGYLLVTGGLFFMTGNWLVGGSMCAYFLAVAARAWKEEEMLLDRLGNAYLEYMSRTNRFLPSPFGPAGWVLHIRDRIHFADYGEVVCHSRTSFRSFPSQEPSRPIGPAQARSGRPKPTLSQANSPAP